MKQSRILVVDNEPNFVRAVREALDTSYEVGVASTRKDGLNKAKKEIPHVIILGYLEPRGDAFQLHKELRESSATKDIPLLVVDVNPEEHARKGWRREDGMRMNSDDYVSRPIDSTDLVELVEEILDRGTAKLMELKDALEQMEGILKRVDGVEKMLAR